MKLKICCMASLDEARLAHRYGATAIGFVGAMPSGPGIISDTQAREIVATAPNGLETFLLTSRETASDIADHATFCGTSTIQIVRHVDPSVLETLRKKIDIKIVQVVHVEDQTSVDLAQAYAPLVDALLLDSGRPGAPTAEFGGTGRTHDWALSQQIVQDASVPVYLAGGLDADNVSRAIAQVQPDGVDLCSGVRTDGHLDEAKLRAFTAALGIS
ncbi:MAG: phosphoribosylanthranilate isomerase [Pseudomonadales bacterium]|nr:phosphoribosylanthranilate isomerase [Pseudomonadales bacterium]